ncbi:hypothetical protein RHMOL_Rhmol11G0015400 [Rhododendron molle]|uniref:Uncharacterized protein n=1 Tax=Rhododendron molle TaxID=49168 RepID=A0ACC0LNP4_RHOML|nr:hypothetical protein RHMOL_Rhmol11G0015400 [Rhododendron molle]
MGSAIRSSGIHSSPPGAPFEAIRASSAAFVTHKPFDLCPGALNPQVSSTLPSSSSGSGPFTPNPSKFHQGFVEEGLSQEAEERARLQHQVQPLVGPTHLEPLLTSSATPNLVESNKAHAGNLVDALSESDSEEDLLEVLEGVEVFQQAGNRLDSEERISSLVRSLEAEMKNSGVLVDCSELKSQLSRLKEHHDLAGNLTPDPDACAVESSSSLSVIEASIGNPSELAEVPNHSGDLQLNTAYNIVAILPVVKDPVAEGTVVNDPVHHDLSISTSTKPHQPGVSSHEEEHDSEEEPIEVLESIVSSSKEVENVSPVKEAVSDGDEKEPPDLLPDAKLLLGGSSKAGHNGKQRSHSKGSQKKRK